MYLRSPPINYRGSQNTRPYKRESPWHSMFLCRRPITDSDSGLRRPLTRPNESHVIDQGLEVSPVRSGTFSKPPASLVHTPPLHFLQALLPRHVPLSQAIITA